MRSSTHTNQNDNSLDRMIDAQCILESCIGVMNSRMEVLDDGVADAARTLLKITHASLFTAIAEDTIDLQEDASRRLYEAHAVLSTVACDMDDTATWGALTVLTPTKQTVNAATKADIEATV